MRSEQRQNVISALEEYLTTPLDTRLEPHPQRIPQQNVLALFHTVATTVPAYRAFLSEHGMDPSSVQTFADFAQIPPLTKQNYLLRYPLPELCRNGRLEACDMIAVSSGSTGKPCFWPRFFTDELNIAWRFEQVFHDSFRADAQRTLAVVCFPLGTWVGGMYTASCCRLLAAKGYPLTIVTPGNNREEIFRVVEELGPFYEQAVLLGYPPFLKGIIDEGLVRGVDWKRYSLKLVMAGEVFSEEWRTLVGERIGAKNPTADSAALYGTADAGVLGNETPLSICIRRWLAANPHAARQLFGESRLPTLVQYDPTSRFFEVQNGTLLFSGDNGVPLLRYNILDTGGLVTYEAMQTLLRDWGFDPWKPSTRKSSSRKPSLRRSLLPETPFPIAGRALRPLPFVYIFGRSDFTVSFYGANIYPENVTVGLEQTLIREWVTGKFVLQVQEDADQNRVLSVVVELAPRLEADAAKRQAIGESIEQHLVRLNSEFAHYVPPERRTPQITLKPTGDPDYFPVGVKHRYTRR